MLVRQRLPAERALGLARLALQHVEHFHQGVHLGTELVVPHLEASRFLAQSLDLCLGGVALGLPLG